MVSKLVTLVGVMYLTTLGSGVSLENHEKNSDDKEDSQKPNPIVRDYTCLRDGDLCHPNYEKNRGAYISCSNGVAWEQTCPQCTYHGIACPTKTLWFDGEKCDWANPKLASEPCVNSFSSDHPLFADILVSIPAAAQSPSTDTEKPQWLANFSQGNMYFKSPKSAGDIEPVYALVNSPDGSEKKVLQRVMQRFILGTAAGKRHFPDLKYISPYATKD